MAFTIGGVSKSRAQVDTFVEKYAVNLATMRKALAALDSVQGRYDALDSTKYPATEFTALQTAFTNEIATAEIVVAKAADSAIALPI
jgi:hypothetical protein